MEGEAAQAEPQVASDQLPSDVPAAAEESVAVEEAGGGDIDAGLGDEELEAAGIVQPDHANGDGRRRRRRGRRGGRRNRREEGEIGISPPENGIAPIEQEIAHAVADFGGPPAVEQGQDERQEEPDHIGAERPDRPHAEAPQPEPAAATANEPVAPPKPELGRRRSTVREPAPFLVGGAAPVREPPPAPAMAPATADAAPPPEPEAVASDAAVEPAAPPPPEPKDEAPTPATRRRAGWWAKRVLGDKR
jgi:ribonuclease E